MRSTSLFVQFAACMSIGFAAMVATANDATPGNPHAAQFETLKSGVSSALTQAQSCVSSAQDHKALHACMEALHESIKAAHASAKAGKSS